MIRPPPKSTLFPYPPLFRSSKTRCERASPMTHVLFAQPAQAQEMPFYLHPMFLIGMMVLFWMMIILPMSRRSEEHTSELQSRLHLVCRLLLEKKKKQQICNY